MIQNKIFKKSGILYINFYFLARWPEDPCLKAKCEIIFHTCPEDSKLQILSTFDDECCPKQGKCICDPDKCAFTNCLPGYERILIQQGIDKPGQCCDEYECRLPGKIFYL